MIYQREWLMVNSNVNVIILADDCHKMKFYGNRSLLKIAGKTLIELQIDILAPVFKNITVVGGFQFPKLRKHLRGREVQLIENADYVDNNDSYSLQLALDHLNNEAALVLGNGTLVEQKTALALTDGKINKIIIEDSVRDSVATNISDGRIIPFAFGLDYKYIPAMFLNKETATIYRQIYKLHWSRIFIFEVINKLIDKDVQFQGIFAEPTDYIHIANLRDYKNTYEDFNQ